MEVEIRSHDAATRKVLGEKVTQYKRSLQSLKSDFENAREQAQRSQLMSRSDEQRQRFIATNDK
jgi:hypothetical protein